MFGKIKQSNEYKTFQNKSIAGSHRIQNRVQNIQIKLWKYKGVEYFEIKLIKDSACSFLLLLLFVGS